MTTIIGAIGALVLGGAIGTFTIVSAVNSVSSPSDSPSSVSSEQGEIPYGSTD
ncbi:hypothetical protein [Nocardioides caricicola]|uniref:DUF2613 family protein n=1 Tax=Nocardioides caricicola TaxID=634770 RepID=A0ABW0N1M6_9ACTN